MKREPITTVYITNRTPGDILPQFPTTATFGLFRLAIYQHETDGRLLTLAIESHANDGQHVLASCNVFIQSLTGAMPDVLRLQSRYVEAIVSAALLRGAAAAIDEVGRE